MAISQGDGAETPRRTPGGGRRAGDELAAAIYALLPYGLVLVDGQGNVLNANPAALEMAWRSDQSSPPTVCHELFACRRGDGPCHLGCLAQRAARRARSG